MQEVGISMEGLNAAGKGPPGSNKVFETTNERGKSKASKRRVGLTQVYPEPDSEYDNGKLKNE